MGFLDSILGEKEEPSRAVQASGKPFAVSMKFVPIRLSAMKEGKIELELQIKNLTTEEQLVSVDGLLPKNILVGFDPTCINKHVEKKVGKIAAGETKEVLITVWGNNQTKEGAYPMELTFYSHYLDYTRVLNYMKKNATVRVL